MFLHGDFAHNIRVALRDTAMALKVSIDREFFLAGILQETFARNSKLFSSYPFLCETNADVRGYNVQRADFVDLKHNYCLELKICTEYIQMDYMRALQQVSQFVLAGFGTVFLLVCVAKKKGTFNVNKWNSLIYSNTKPQLWDKLYPPIIVML